MCLLVCMCIVVGLLGGASSPCPPQCSCDYHGRKDGSGSRSVLCNDPDMNEVPTNLPADTAKLRIERTAVRGVPARAFYYLLELRYLWLAYNALASVEPGSFYNLRGLHELRLDGNVLAAFPWASLADVPRLKTLDLRNNRIASVPGEAGRYLTNLAYLDLSSNRLGTLPPDFLQSWPRGAGPPPRSPDFSPGRVVLGLQDNPWLCDCRLSSAMELAKAADAALVLLDPLLVCSGPERLAGIPFQRAELEQCLKPVVTASATRITSALGSNVLLRCDATGFPTPQLTWTRDSWPVNGTVIQESPGDGVRWSIVSLTGISYTDAGDYKCTAKNLAGISEAVVTMTVVGAVTATPSPGTSDGRMGGHSGQQVQPGSGPSTSTHAPLSPPQSAFSPRSSVSFSLSPFFSMASLTTLGSSVSSAGAGAGRPSLQLPSDGRSSLEAGKKASERAPASAHRKEELPLWGRAPETDATVQDLRVVGETEDSVTLTWHTSNATRPSAVTVLYSKYGEKDLMQLHADASNNQVTIEGLEPSRQYLVCVCPRGAPAQRSQCVTFATDRAEDGDSQWVFLMVVTAAACAVAGPLICFLLYKLFKLRCSSESLWEDDLVEETYVRFETLSPGSLSTGELWGRRHREDSEKLLLCSRASVGLQAAFKSEGCRREYYC